MNGHDICFRCSITLNYQMELTDGMTNDSEKRCIIYDSCMPLLALRENQKINFLKEEENNNVKS